MDLQRVVPARLRWFAAAAAGAGVVLGLVGAGWTGAVAGAGALPPGLRAHGRAVEAARQQREVSKLPVIGNATDLKREPVVHATKGAPPTKLEVKNLVVGSGAVVTRSSTVSVMYVGANYKTGKVFTRVTWTDKRPTAFPLSGVVPGFAEGLLGMRVGGRREIVIPPKLGYGATGEGPIEPNETLVFVVDLKGVSK